jgi:hypothetical protein
MKLVEDGRIDEELKGSMVEAEASLGFERLKVLVV